MYPQDGISLLLLRSCLLSAVLVSAVQSQDLSTTPTAGSASGVPATAIGAKSLTFLLFHRGTDGPTEAMQRVIATAIAQRDASAELTLVNVADPSQEAIVSQFGVARAPLPIAVAVAPNGAVTGIFPRRITPQAARSCFVSPATMELLKALQEKKLVFLWIRRADNEPRPAAIGEFEVDPHFAERMTTLAIRADDRSEQGMLRDLGIDPAASPGSLLVVLAPPSAKVGQFPATASKTEIAMAIADAGKCCDDPACKHHRR